MTVPASVETTSEHRDATLHAALRFAVGVSGAFVISEVLQWKPTFLAPVFTAVLLAKLPIRPSLRLALVLILTMAAAALSVFVIASLMRGTPIVLFGLIALGMFLAFLAMLGERPGLPLLLLLICLSTIPVVVMIAPGQAAMFPMALIRSIVLALSMIGLAYLPWPRIVPATPVPPAEASAATPLTRALLSTAVVMPVMLVYLMFGLADVLPVLVATVMLVVNFDLRASRAQALGMVIGNFAGGLLGLLLHGVLMTTPGLPFLVLLLFAVLLGIGQRIVAGGPMGGVALIACNAMLIILSSAIASGPGSLSLWLARLFQFSLAGALAVGMMTLSWHGALSRRAAPPAAR